MGIANLSQFIFKRNEESIKTVITLKSHLSDNE